MSIPRYTCIESTEIISPESFSASSVATSDFPVAVGPAIRMCSKLGVAVCGLAILRLQIFGCRNGWARQNQEQQQAGYQNHNADQMCRSEPSSHKPLILRIIAAKHFHKRSQHRVADQVSRKNLPVKFFTPIQPGQGQIQP